MLLGGEVKTTKSMRLIEIDKARPLSQMVGGARQIADLRERGQPGDEWVS
jgi:hypothetical protein